MPRYIDADFCKMIGGTCIAIRITSTGEVFPIAGLDVIPTADVVEVVRCKDCKYNCFNAEAGIAKCCMFHAKTNLYGFCYLGERRTDETD